MLKQARLCFSSSGKLAYCKPKDPPPTYPLPNLAQYSPKYCDNDSLILNDHEPYSRPHLLRLPNELLWLILRYVLKEPVEFSLVDGAYWDLYWDYTKNSNTPRPMRGWARYAAAYRLIWVCRRFHDLVLPLMYENVSLDVTHYLDCPPQEKLFRDAILRRPLLQNYIKHLATRWQSFESPIVRLACTLLYISRLSLELVRDDGIEPSLIGPTKDQRGTANFTRIQFHNLRARPEAVKRFLEWPKKLYEFVVNDMTYDGYSWADTESDPSYRWNHKLLVDILSPQKDHLRILDLGWLGYDRDQNAFQAFAFPNLQSMAFCVAYEHPDKDACRNWLTPSLNTLILDLHKNDSEEGPFCHNCMSKRNAKSIVTFVKQAKEWSDESYGTVGLRRIGIRAYTRGDYAWSGEAEVSCLHGKYGGEMKSNLLQCLKDIEAQGFEAFWVGYSGNQYTVEMMEAMCRCKNK